MLLKSTDKNSVLIIFNTAFNIMKKNNAELALVCKSDFHRNKDEIKVIMHFQSSFASGF